MTTPRNGRGIFPKSDSEQREFYGVYGICGTILPSLSLSNDPAFVKAPGNLDIFSGRDVIIGDPHKPEASRIRVDTGREDGNHGIDVKGKGPLKLESVHGEADDAGVVTIKAGDKVEIITEKLAFFGGEGNTQHHPIGNPAPDLAELKAQVDVIIECLRSYGLTA